MDYFIIVPNGLGAILGFIQMFLRLVVPSRDLFSSDEREREDDVELPGSVPVLDADIEATASASTHGEASKVGN